jgi:small subunit ribosomal protein S20
MRQNEKRRGSNRALRSLVKTQIKNVLSSVESGDSEQARQALRSTQKVLMKAAARSVIKKGTASRHASRLAKKVASIPGTNAQAGS